MISRSLLTAILILFIATACTLSPPEPVHIEALNRQIDYITDIKPILDTRCVVCHSCYNAPCQLKLSSFEGLDRGASKTAVYNAARIMAQQPTRLFTDAQTTEQWRDKDFFSVTENAAEHDKNNSILLQLLDAKRKHPSNTGEYFPETSTLACAADTRQLSYLKKHPNQGMPYGFPPLTDAEFGLVANWLQQGSIGPTTKQQQQLKTPSLAAQAEIQAWENFFNQDDAKHAMTARYLFEHLFLAHLNFAQNAPEEFFELVRSRTPSGEPIDIIATVRPYDDPGVDAFYYRFRKIHATIVHKTHMVFKLNDSKLRRIQALFIEPEWNETPYRVGFNNKISANPFLAFAQIPAQSRYQFLLDNSEYIIRTFIRGPVCKGQIALNVIHDHFWVMFLDPNSDMTIQEPGFLTGQTENLSLPTEKGSTVALRKLFSNVYRNHYSNFYHAKNELYRQYESKLDLNSIWQGGSSDDAPVLTVYRHFDSASVHKGVLGGLPRTMWIIDYPLFERIYYALVAGFDVFGNVTHQTNVRRYMDYLRMEGESNFISFLPAEVQVKTFRSWYIGDKSFSEVEFEISNIARNIGYKTNEPKRELIERIVDEHILKSTGIAFDQVNYYRAGEAPPQMPTSINTQEDILTALRSLNAPGTAFIKNNTDEGINVLYLHVSDIDDEEDAFISIVINRWHDNVNSLFSERSRLNPAKDTMDFFKASLSSYPNYFFSVAARDLADFFNLMANFDPGDEKIISDLKKLGVNRSDENFWHEFDWFQQEFIRREPLESGLYDLNRYYHMAL